MVTSQKWVKLELSREAHVARADGLNATFSLHDLVMLCKERGDCLTRDRVVTAIQESRLRSDGSSVPYHLFDDPVNRVCGFGV